MTILNQRKTRLVNYETSMRNHDLSTGIYLTDAKVAQYRLMAENRKEKEEAKKETAKKTATTKLNIQQKRCEDFSEIIGLKEQSIVVSHRMIDVHKPC